MKKPITLLSFGAVLFISSCAYNDPEYQAYKKEKAAEKLAQAANPYSAPALPGDIPAAPVTNSNPFAAPITPPISAGYQDLPPLPSSGSFTSPAANNGINIPAVAANAALGNNGGFIGNTINHTVGKGDTIWGLAKQYKTNQADIIAANLLTTDVIQLGQVLKIPAQ